eukprot:scaffold1401_cov330-Pavlova_lutheri.AAC.147
MGGGTRHGPSKKRTSAPCPQRTEQRFEGEILDGGRRMWAPTNPHPRRTVGRRPEDSSTGDGSGGEAPPHREGRGPIRIFVSRAASLLANIRCFGVKGGGGTRPIGPLLLRWIERGTANPLELSEGVKYVWALGRGGRRTWTHGDAGHHRVASARVGEEGEECVETGALLHQSHTRRVCGIPPAGPVETEGPPRRPLPVGRLARVQTRLWEDSARTAFPRRLEASPGEHGGRGVDRILP